MRVPLYEVCSLPSASEEATKTSAVGGKDGEPSGFDKQSHALYTVLLLMGIGYVSQSTQRLVPESRCRVCDVIFFH